MSSKLLSSSLHSSPIDCFKVGEFERRLDALLADLQNSIPGRMQPQHQYGTANANSINHHQQAQKVNYVDNNGGYGSLRGGNKPLPQPPVHQQHYTSEIRSSASPQPHQGYNGTGANHTSQMNSYQSKGAIPRNAYNGHAGNHNNSKGLAELDSLLEDLNIEGYNSRFERKEPLEPIYSSPAQSKYNTFNSYASIEDRPTKDSLLNEMDNLAIYSVPHGSEQKSPTPGRHVTITVRETKTEKLTGPDGPVGSIEEQIVHKKNSFTPNHAVNNSQRDHMYVSPATRELDEIMASLSDMQANNGSNHHHQTVTDYAKPNKGTSHLTQTITETTYVEDDPSDEIPDQLESMLGSLQANMSRQGVNTVQKGCCNACEKPIVGQVITALGKTWHPEHFTCNHCNQELGTRNFFERDGFPYCEPDYHNLFSPRCAYCNGAILDKCVTALDKTWHTEHFFCAQCGQQFGEDGFHERDGKPYCRTDYFEMFAPKCNGCNRAIMENYISALNSQWHPDCFVCRDCKKAVRGKSFYAMEGKPVCPTCVGVDEEE